MAETVTMPKLGFDMAEGTLVRWVKPEGDPVAKGEVLAEIETDKATVEVESNFSGVVRRHLVEQGSVVPVGTPIALIAGPDETEAESQAENPSIAPTQAPEQKAEPKIQPQNNGENKANPPAEIKQAAEPVIPSPAAAPSETRGSEALESGHSASPLARRIARERGLDLTQLQGSGPGGRIVRRDLETMDAAPIQASAAPPAGPSKGENAARSATQPAVAPLTWMPGEMALHDEVVPLERLRAAIGRRMQVSKQQLPHFYVTYDYDMAPVMALRKQVNETLPEGQKLSVNDFIVKAVALTLLQYPNLNASIEENQIHHHGHINVGVAVAVPGGLMTVVSRDTDQKPMLVLSKELREMVSRARSGKVRPNDIEGSTFSISNLGMYNVDEFIAIINPPEAAILAVGAAKEAPAVVNGELKVGMRMKATISADHRVTDGAEAAQFMQSLSKVIETPLRLLL